MSEPVNAAPVCEPPQQEDLSGPPAANRHRLPNERVGLTPISPSPATRAI